MHEFLVALANATGEPLPIPRIYGILETDLGPGLAVEKVTNGSGEIAPNYEAELLRTGDREKYERLLVELVENINRHRIVLTELKNSNILCVREANGAERLILIDGFGDSSLIPIHSLGRAVSTWWNMRKYRKMLTRKERQRIRRQKRGGRRPKR
jgi:hypothetical protein